MVTNSTPARAESPDDGSRQGAIDPAATAMHHGMVIYSKSIGHPRRKVYCCTVMLGDSSVYVSGESLGAIIGEIDVAVARLADQC